MHKLCILCMFWYTWYSEVTESMVATRLMQMVRRKATTTITTHSCRLLDFTSGFFYTSR
jgi:hypothetical protein